MKHIETIQLGTETVTIETGRMARQTAGTALVTIGDTVVLVTACASNTAREGISFFPLSCDYVEKTYAAGKIPGGYLKREGRLSDTEILTCRLIDRPIRPLFPKAFRCETQVIATVLSTDKQNDPAINAIIGAGAALHISDIPFEGPVAGSRVGRVDGEFVLNPTFEQLEESDLELLVVVSPDGISMVEGGAFFVEEQVIVDALEFASSHLAPVMDGIQRMRDAVGKEKRIVAPIVEDEDLKAQFREIVWPKIGDAVTIPEKLPRYAALDALWEVCYAEMAEKLGEGADDRKGELKGFYGGFKSEYVRTMVLEKGIRIDGRDTKTVRPLNLEVGVLPRTHGSALFTRGETQALATITLGTSHDEQRIDGLNGDFRKSFMLHYNFPPYCVGETKFLRGPARREIGHGMLAERGVEKVLPDQESFPYTVRVVSEVMESNGSSSMATVCAASMALMDAGVPVSSAVAGVAMGLIKEGDNNAILTDILGDEDHLGDMDFKVVGNSEGISSVQMDIKIKGMEMTLMAEALAQARDARLHILKQMDECIPAGRQGEEGTPLLSEHAPQIFTILISPDRIRDLIGPGGKHIKGIVEQTGAKIDVDDDGRVNVAAIDKTAAYEAIELIKSYTASPEIGETYLGQVVKITDFGAFVNIMPGTDGLCHISELSLTLNEDGTIAEHQKRIRTVTDVVSEGDEIRVKVLDIDRSGKIRLSRKEAMRDAVESRQTQGASSDEGEAVEEAPAVEEAAPVAAAE
jgi:polyribonucleotide nucleotidyltransferase